MASLVTVITGLRNHYGKTISTIVLVFSLFLYNQRWTVGAQRYRSEFELAAGGSNAINPDCNHTLNEQNIWNGVSCNEHWYFVSGCEGNRDGCEIFLNQANVSASDDSALPGIYIDIQQEKPDSSDYWKAILNFLNNKTVAATIVSLFLSFLSVRVFTGKYARTIIPIGIILYTVTTYSWDWWSISYMIIMLLVSLPGRIYDYLRGDFVRDVEAAYEAVKTTAGAVGQVLEEAFDNNVWVPLGATCATAGVFVVAIIDRILGTSIGEFLVSVLAWVLQKTGHIYTYSRTGLFSMWWFPPWFSEVKELVLGRQRVSPLILEILKFDFLYFSVLYTTINVWLLILLVLLVVWYIYVSVPCLTRRNLINVPSLPPMLQTQSFGALRQGIGADVTMMLVWVTEPCLTCYTLVVSVTQMSNGTTMNCSTRYFQKLFYDLCGCTYSVQVLSITGQ
jgi:hypothetical protein